LTLDTNLNEEQKDYLGMVQSSADSLLNLVNKLLDFSKIESGAVILEEEPFSLRETIESVTRTFSEQAANKALGFTRRIPLYAPHVLIGGAGRLRQVIVNLVGNAVRYTEKGEVRLQVTEVRRNESHIELRFSVSDTGPGIPEEKRPEIFEAFTRAEGSTARTYGGNGLGLAISHRLVEVAGVKMPVESEPGRGSVFEFTMLFALQPRSADAGAADLEDEASALARHVSNHEKSSRFHILIAEDNPINQKLAVRLLEKRGYRATLP